MDNVMHQRQPPVANSNSIIVATYLSVASIFLFAIRAVNEPTLFLPSVMLMACLLIIHFQGKLYLDRTMTFLLAAVALHGSIGIFAGFHSAALLLKILSKIFLYYIAFSSILRWNNNNVIRIVDIYVKICVALAIFGLVGLILFKFGFRYAVDLSWLVKSYRITFSGGLFGLPRAQSIFAEPAHAAYAMGPVMFFALGRIFGEHKSFISLYGAAAILVFLLLTGSTTAYAAFGVAALLTVRITIKQVIIGAAAALIMIAVVRPDFSSVEYKLRQAQEIFQNDGYVEGISSTSYSLYLATVISGRSIKDTYGFGSGIGSFEHAYSRYVGNIDTYGGNMGNYQTGSSLFNRTMTELGLFGVILWLTAIVMTIKGLLRFSGERKAIHLAMAVGFVPFFVRQGTYQNHGLALFVLIFLINYRSAMSFSFRPTPNMPPNVAATHSLQYQPK